MASANKPGKLLLGVTAALIVASPYYASSLTPKAHAATVSSGITAVSNFVKPIKLNAASTLSLVDATLAPTENGQTAAFTLSIYNGGTATLDLTDYWFRLSSTGGSNYSINTSSADAKLTKVAPKSTALLTVYANVGDSTKLSDLIFKVVRFDFSVAGYEVGVGRFTFPKNYNNEVAVGSYKALYFSNSKVFSKVSSATIGNSGDNNYATINFVYNNVGKSAVTLSGYKYYIVTSEGIRYEATSSEVSDSDGTGSQATGSGNADLVLDPLERDEFQLTATIPAKLKTTGWKLLVVRTDGSSGAEGATTTTPIAVGTYGIAFGNATTTTSSDNFSYSNSEGKYQFSLLELNRHPFETQDILSARIRIKNVSSTPLTLPAISGYFYLDDKTKLDFKTVATTNQLALNSNGYVDVDVYAKLPSNYTYKTAKVVVNNTVDKVATKIGELSASSSTIGMPIYAVDKPYVISRDGSDMTGVLNSVNVYNSVTTKVFTVQMTLTNDELRTIDPLKLVGIFKSDNGDVFPATATMADGKVNASNKALVTFSANVPQNYDTNNLRLIIGEGVTDTAYTSGTAAFEGYVNPVTFNLPNDQAVNNSFKDVTTLPYQFTINTLTPTVMGNDVQLTLYYDLNKDTGYNVYPTDRKLQLTVEATNPNDGTQYTYFTQDLTLEGDSDTALQAGTDQKIVLSKTNPYNGIDGSLKYTLKLYEIVNGAKKVIAERPIDFWFIDNDWNATSTN
ncbi:hypothetical protein [Cohnella zeiphila]|uniref:Uncharacterized protein n=1 Tax=Cohnella zeiphila TaxID=2761120 RepID=A0A7X0VWA3_9BACL|nr:hypothetical protein [Cohnella zeiphila]MBB6732295.1 hypothetical protein [Cohnella zeiphila]